MDLPIEVTLKRPVVVDDKTYDKLVFDEPDLAAQIAFAELEESFPDLKTITLEGGAERKVYPPVVQAKVTLFWIARLSGVPEKVACKIKESDLEAVNRATLIALGHTVDDVSSGGSTGGLGNETPAK